VALSLSLVMARRALALNRRVGAKTLLEHATDTGAGFALVVPPIVIGTGWFLLLRTVSNVFAVAPVMVVTVNAVMAMPFAIRAIRPGYDAASERHERIGWSTGRLCGGRSPPVSPLPWRCRSAISASLPCSAAIPCRHFLISCWRAWAAIARWTPQAWRCCSVWSVSRLS
jgi:hypothetical protein